MVNFSDPAFIEWLSTLAISIGVALIVASLISLWSGRLLGLAPAHKVWAFIVGFAFLCGLTTLPLTDQRTWMDTVFFATLPALVILIYFLPTAAAISLGHAHFQSVFVMNLVFGWTVAGWIVALVWALRKPALLEFGDYRITPFGVAPAHKAGAGKTGDSRSA